MIERMKSGVPKKSNVVYLPGKKQRIVYDNNTDVLCLRFGSYYAIEAVTHSFFTDGPDPNYHTNISMVLEGMWSKEMAASLCDARRVAIDMSELWSPSEVNPVIIEEVASLCSCLQNGLVVLYLIDYCVGRCGRCWKGRLTSKDLQARKCALAKELDGQDREMDVIYGVGVTYREICDLEKLGWDSEHSMFLMARLMGEMIKEQQGLGSPFHSVRLLVCEEEMAQGRDRIVYTSCGEQKM
jgi:hypothetical protein